MCAGLHVDARRKQRESVLVAGRIVPDDSVTGQRLQCRESACSEASVSLWFDQAGPGRRVETRLSIPANTARLMPGCTSPVSFMRWTSMVAHLFVDCSFTGGHTFSTSTRLALMPSKTVMAPVVLSCQFAVPTLQLNSMSASEMFAGSAWSGSTSTGLSGSGGSTRLTPRIKPLMAVGGKLAVAALVNRPHGASAPVWDHEDHAGNNFDVVIVG